MFLLFIGALAGLLIAVRGYWQIRRRYDQLDEEKQRIAEEKQIVIDFMHGMVEAVGEGLTRDELFQRIVHAAILSTGALSACIFELNSENKLRGIAVEGLFPPHRPLPENSKLKLTSRAKFLEQVLKSETFDVSEGVAGECVRARKAILIPDALSDPRVVRHTDPSLIVKSLIVAPILFRDRMIGVLAVANPTDGLPFSEMDLSLVQSLAEQSALAVHNAEFLSLQIEKKRIDLDLALASNIQHMLLPSAAPKLDGLDADARFSPAQQVGGDLYDFFALDDHRLAVAVADVSGKGIPASLLMAICRTNLRQLGSMYESPARVLTELNQAMSGQLTDGMFITVLYAVVDTRRGEVTYARAGHELPIFVRLDSVTGTYRGELTEGGGLPIGIVETEFFAEAISDRTERFSWGDVLVLYTDGVTEAPNDEGKEFSAQRLADVARTLHTRRAKEINDAIIETVERFAGSQLHRDDLTLVTIKRV